MSVLVAEPGNPPAYSVPTACKRCNRHATRVLLRWNGKQYVNAGLHCKRCADEYCRRYVFKPEQEVHP